MISYAVVQFDKAGVERTMQVALPEGRPRSAVAGERFAEAVTFDVLKREIEREREREREREGAGAPHAPGSMRMAVNCSAMVNIEGKGVGP